MENPADKAKLLFTGFLTRSLVWLLFFAVLSGGAFVLKKSIDSSLSFQASNKEEKTKLSLPKQEVLGDSTAAPSFSIYGGDYDLSGGVIALSKASEPVIRIQGYDISGEAEIKVYKAQNQNLIDYLIHDDEGSQINKIDASSLEFLSSFKENINSGYDNAARITLPIEGEGVWYLEVLLSGKKDNVFVVRSSIGAVVKEAQDEMIIWGQDLVSKKSLNSGGFKTYSLTKTAKEISDTSFDQQGIAKLALDEKAEIGFVYSGLKLALVPISLRSLNRGYNSSGYNAFSPQKRNAKFYVFSDRPLYRPGDKIYFKSIIRDDDDARYSIPSGSASVKIFKDWDEKNSFFEKTFPINSEGAVYGEIEVPEDIPTGDYALKIDLSSNPEDYSLRGYASFSIEHFRKPEYTIDISVPKTEFVAHDELDFEILGKYFSGQTITDKDVKYRIFASDFYEYDYLVQTKAGLNDDYQYGARYGKTILENRAGFNKQGIAQVNTKIEFPKDARKPQIFSIEAEFDDGSGNPVFARKNILVYPGLYGIYREDHTYTAKTGEKFSLPIILAKRRETKLNKIGLKAKLLRSTWVSYQEPDKKFPSYKKEEENLPEMFTKTDQAGKAVFEFTPQKQGSYKITVEGEDEKGNLIQKEFHIWVVSSGQPIYKGNESGLSIQPDKGIFKHNETARLTILSDIPDRDVFLSIDRDYINRYQVVKLIGKSAVVDLPLVETDIPNVFASVASFSDNNLDTDREEITVSSDPKKLKISLAAERQTYGPGDTVQIDLKTADLNGNPVSADLAVWAVDKAIFELKEINTNIFDLFWSKRWDGTMMVHSLQGINTYLAEGGGGCFAEGTKVLMNNGKQKNIENVKVGDAVLTRKSEKDPGLKKAKVIGIHSQEAGGYLIVNQSLKVTPNHRLWVNGRWQEAGSIQTGDVLKDKNDQEVKVISLEWQKGKSKVYNLEIEDLRTYFAGGVWVHNQKGGGARSVFKDTAYWNPSVKTDDQGKAKLSFRLPDNLTTWVIASVGATDDTMVGQTTNEVVVAKGMIVRPILPNIMRVGEEMVLSALAQNFTGKDRVFDISLGFDSGEILGDKIREKSIKADSAEQAYWTVRADKENENAELTFSATAKDDKNTADTVIQKIPVQKFGFWEKTGEIKNGEGEYSLNLSDDSDKDKTKISLSLSPTLLGTLPKAMKYLVNYPYGCVEQTTSSFVPAVIAKANPDIFEQAIEGKNLDEIIEKGVKRLSGLQKSDGGWAWWYNGKSNSFITAYVVEYLLEASRLGIEADEEVLNSARRFLQKEYDYDLATGQQKAIDRDEWVARIYGRTLLGDSAGNNFSIDLEGLSPDILSLAVITNTVNGNMNPKVNGLDKLVSLAKTQGDVAYWEAGKDKFFGSKDASTAMAMRAVVFADGDRELSAKAARYLLRSRRSDYWSNTFATAQVIRAVVDFSQKGADIIPDYSYAVKLDGKIIGQGTVEDYKKPLDEIEINPSEIKKGSKLAIEKSAGAGQIYSSLTINEFHTDTNAKAKNSGLEVKREYVNEKGEEYSLGVGDVVDIKITVGGLGAPEKYGVIVDELPAGMVPINESMKNEQYNAENSMDYQYGVSDRETTKNGMILSLQTIEPGTKTYSYKARVISGGIFKAPPATASLMYDPDIYGRSQAQTVEIKGDSRLAPAKMISKKVKDLFGNKKLLLVVAGSLLILTGTTALAVIKTKGKLKFFGKKKPNSSLENPQQRG